MGRTPFTTETFAKLVEDKSDGKISLISEYVRISDKVKFKCNVCEFEFEMTPNRFQCGDRCKKCSGKYKPTTEEVQKEIDNIYGIGKYTILTEYINNQSDLTIMCNTCKEHFITRRDYLINDKQKIPCPNCRKGVYTNIPFTDEEYLEKFNNAHKNDPYVLLEKYSDTKGRQNIKAKRLKHDYIWEPNKNHLIREDKPTGCPICSSSQGEKKIRNFLIENEIPFEKEVSFSDLIDQAKLKFDFKIYNESMSDFFLVEYDGSLHEEAFSESDYSEAKFKKTKRHDKMKNDYCQLKNIKLLRINYRDFNNISEILQNYINTVF
jgi:rubrerythrin